MRAALTLFRVEAEEGGIEEGDEEGAAAVRCPAWTAGPSAGETSNRNWPSTRSSNQIQDSPSCTPLPADSITTCTLLSSGPRGSTRTQSWYTSSKRWSKTRHLDPA